jgi:hypothetical protein
MRETEPLPFVSQFGDLLLRVLQLCCMHICFLREKPDKREKPSRSQEAHSVGKTESNTEVPWRTETNQGDNFNSYGKFSRSARVVFVPSTF